MTSSPPPLRSRRPTDASTAITIKQAAVRLAALFADRDAWLRAAEIGASAERWTWAAAGAQLGRIPAAHRLGDPAGAEPVLLDSAPDQPHDEELYGLDAAGEVVTHRDWAGAAGPRIYAYDRTGPGTLIHRWDRAGEPAGIELVQARGDGRILHTVDVNAAGECFAERYLWGEAGLQAVELLAVSASERPQARRVRVTDRLVYPAAR